MFVANYKTLWTSALENIEVENAQVSIWYELLKAYSEAVIQQATWEAIKKHKVYPPTIGEFLEIVKMFDDKLRSEKEIADRHQATKEQGTMRPEEFLEKRPEHKALWEKCRNPPQRTRAAYEPRNVLNDGSALNLEGLVPWQESM